jgi:hypothetical protein
MTRVGSYRDVLGNFSSIVRTDLVKSGGSWTTQQIDNLTFNYPNAKSNRISSITDATNNPAGYRSNNGAYTYDANRNTTHDPANKISTVYNYLNLPSRFTKDDGTKQEVMVL